MADPIPRHMDGALLEFLAAKDALASHCGLFKLTSVAPSILEICHYIRASIWLFRHCRLPSR